jgi:nitrogen regulatory protein PII
MANIDCKLVTIITEAVLEPDLLEELEELGASGYTITEARGAGNRGVRDAGWSSSGNVRVEVVCGNELADRIAERLRDKYYDHYAMIFFESDVRVLRPGKFS